MTALSAVAAAALFGDGVGGIGVFVYLLLTGTLLVIGGVRRPEAVAVLGCAVACAAMLALGESLWLRFGLVPLTLGLLVAAVMVSRRGSWFDVSWRGTWLASGAMWLHAFTAPLWLGRGLRKLGSRRGWVRTAMLGRLAALVLPVLAILVGLLASADTLFASLVEFDPNNLIMQLWWAGAGAALFATLLRCALIGVGAADDAAAGKSERRGLRVSRLESSVLLGTVALVLAMFVATQVFAEFDVGRAALARRGMPYAEHARSGYVQLLFVVAMIAMVLLAVDRLATAGPGRLRLIERMLSMLIVVLALAIAGVAVRRLAMYCDAFGLTMLRITCVAGAIWMAVTLLLLLVRAVGVGGRRNWVPGAAAIGLVVVTCAFALVNPQRIVVEYDVAHASTVPLDLRYLTSMSTDAAPALVAALPQLTADQSDYVIDRLCSRDDKPAGWSQTSVSAVAARRALDPVCPR